MTQYRRIEIDGVRYYGKHLVLTALGCNEALLAESRIAQFMQTLVPRIGMVAFGEPAVHRFGSGIETGISGVQLIETSAITIHTNDLCRDLYLDVFSCKGYSELDVIAFLRESFAPREVTWQVLLR